MKFDVVVGNPPYQEDTKGAGRQARPVYPAFVNLAKSLTYQYISMITPSRWFSGGMGLANFRTTMMNDNHLKILVDYTNSKNCFPGISISGGVSYFIIDLEYSGECEFTNNINNYHDTMIRSLNEFPIVIRYNSAIPIIHKIKSHNEPSLDKIMSSLMPYGLSTNYRGSDTKNTSNDLTLHASTGTTYINRAEISNGEETINKYKIMISKTSAEHGGEPGSDGKFSVIPSSVKVLGPKEVCTHSYFTMGAWNDKIRAHNALIYMKTRLVRFLGLLCISGFGLSKQVFNLVPLQDFTSNSDIDWTKPISEIDQQLYKKYGLNQEEINFIEEKVKAMD